jgi:hypothetical protein
MFNTLFTDEESVEVLLILRTLFKRDFILHRVRPRGHHYLRRMSDC